uniref:Mpv17-like protein n=1 Tax=Parasteatoda tepidariorum TaxID=114398 RepID=A0A2L2YMJ1_PARTP
MLKSVIHLFRKRPLLMNMTTFGTAYVSASFTNQLIKKHLLPDKKDIDFRNVVNHGIIGYCIMGPVLYGWFRFFNKILPAVSKRNIIFKVLVDLAVCTPGTISIYFTSMSILEGREDIFAELKHRFSKVMTCNICFWVPAQAISYRFIPPYFRVGFIGFALFIWINIICVIRSQEIPIRKKVEIPAVFGWCAVTCSPSSEVEGHKKQRELLTLWEV